MQAESPRAGFGWSPRSAPSLIHQEVVTHGQSKYLKHRYVPDIRGVYRPIFCIESSACGLRWAGTLPAVDNKRSFTQKLGHYAFRGMEFVVVESPADLETEPQQRSVL
jgi:hypothetical protein